MNCKASFPGKLNYQAYQEIILLKIARIPKDFILTNILQDKLLSNFKTPKFMIKQPTAIKYKLKSCRNNSYKDRIEILNFDQLRKASNYEKSK